uniref:Uncharacterized protein n=1 Tax=Tanacetum cinerariifolium TaxID=118510 RepID=A0A699H8J8_TANCI|nr:hypothetical protein [Tanacetum cinerariifolium]
MASPQASICKPSKNPKFTLIPHKQLFNDLTKEDTTTSSLKFQVLSPSAPNALSKTPSTKDISSSSIDYPPKSPTLLSSPSTNGYLNSLLSPPPRVLPPPPTQASNSMEITLSLSPITLLDVHHNSPSLSSPIIGHPIPWNLLEAHGDSCLCFVHNRTLIFSNKKHTLNTQCTSPIFSLPLTDSLFISPSNMPITHAKLLVII